MTLRRYALWLLLLYVGFLTGGEWFAHDHAGHETAGHESCVACVWHATHQTPPPSLRPHLPAPPVVTAEQPATRSRPQFTFFSPAAPSRAPPACS